MASVCGILSDSPDRERRIGAMFDAAPHRGSPLQTVTLGRCTLGVTEEPGWHEAGVAEEGGSAAAFVGTIDNLADLSQDPRPPAEVVLEGFRRDGAGFLRRLRGAFAGAITEGSTIWSFRDHLGFATLFYGKAPGAVVVATEAKQVAAGLGRPREPDIEVLELIFYDDCDDHMPTAIKGVSRLPKASLLEATADRARWRRYWEPSDVLETARPSPDEVRERFAELMTQAVARTFTGSDCVSLSGGIDSPAIAAFGHAEHLRMFGTPLAALSVLYPDQPSVDEEPYIRAVAAKFDLPLHTYERTARPLDALAERVQLLDGPVPKILSSDAIEHYEWAQKLGFRTMLTGEVAELVFDQKHYVVPHLIWHGRFGAAYRLFRTQRRAGVPWIGIGRQLGATVLPRSLVVGYEMVKRYQLRARIPDWLDARRIRSVRAKRNFGPRKQWERDQLNAYTGPGLIMESDSIIQAAYGVRVRRPWADIDLWEFFLSLPADVKTPHPRRKALVRDLLKGYVPDLILDRQLKTGYDDSLMARIDYPKLRQIFKNADLAIPGVDYARLQEHLDREDFDPADYMWAKDLAAVHAFAEPERVSP